MDINKMNPVRISPFASARVIVDHFPDDENEKEFRDFYEDLRDVAMSAGALCLYAATLLTMVYENETESIEYEAEERKQELKQLIKSKPKFSKFTDEQIDAMVNQLILKDIRNSFAHGNFEIDYDVYSKRLYFVLKPIRKDFIVDKPIIISKEVLFRLNQAYINKRVRPYKYFTDEQLESKVRANMGEPLKDFLLADDMLKLASNYINPKLKHYEKFKPERGRYVFDYYPLLVSQIVYEQNDYYKIFGKDSNVFKKLSHLRNALSHHKFTLDVKSRGRDSAVNWFDTHKSDTENLAGSVEVLKRIRDQKCLVDIVRVRDGEESLQALLGILRGLFDRCFSENEDEFDFEIEVDDDMLNLFNSI